LRLPLSNKVAFHDFFVAVHESGFGQSGRAVLLRSCPLSGVKRTSQLERVLFANDP
jgi:hypothetical protein